MVMVSIAIGLHRKGGRSPPPKRGRLGGGRCVTDTLLSPSACSTEGFFAEKRLPYPAQQGAGKGLVKGESVPLDRVLVPFTRVKGTPRRRAVLTKFSKRLAPLKAISRYNLTGRGARVRDCDWPRKYPAEGEKKLCHTHLPEGKKKTVPCGRRAAPCGEKKKPPWGLWVRAVTAAGCRARGGSARR